MGIRLPGVRRSRGNNSAPLAASRRMVLAGDRPMLKSGGSGGLHRARPPASVRSVAGWCRIVSVTRHKRPFRDPMTRAAVAIPQYSCCLQVQEIMPVNIPKAWLGHREACLRVLQPFAICVRLEAPRSLMPSAHCLAHISTSSKHTAPCSSFIPGSSMRLVRNPMIFEVIIA